MKHNTLSRIWALLLVICLVAGLIPGYQMAVEAEAVSGVNSLTCADFISNSTRRTYIDTMMHYYINNYSKLSTTLDNGYSVVFMFEGGSDNYDSYEYVDACGSYRIQAVCIVVQKNSSGNAEIVFYSENCSSIPDDANWVTEGYETSGSTTILDGIYSMYTCNHNGSYAAYTTDCYTGWYNPYSGYTGYADSCNGINIHTRSGSTCGGASYGWANSAGCQVIGYGASTDNSFNEFMKVTAGITWNSYTSTRNTFSSTGYFKGYYVVDRQLGLVSPDGTEYGSGSLAEMYTQGALTGITEFSTAARANANFGYLSQCDSYPSHCTIKMTMDTEVNSLPCSVGTDDECTVVENCYTGDTYEATGLYRNSYGNLWYEVISKSGETGYVYAGECSYVKNLTDDISLSSGATAPNGHVVGNVFVVNGTISSKYSGLTEASVYVYEGFGTDTTPVTGDAASFSGKSYVLDSSTIDYNTSFNTLTAGKHTYAIATKYTNYYASDATTLASTSGTIDLMKEYFMVISAAADQSTCSHSYAESTTLKAATCTTNGTQVTSCATCGYVVTESVTKLGHSYGAWTTTKAATCTTDGSRTHTCSNCGNVETQTITAGGHNYTATTLTETCQSHAGTRYTCSACGDTYDSYADSLYTAWSTTAPSGVADNLIQTKTQYRYADQVTTTSSSASLSGYELVGSAWDSGTAGSVAYAPDIASTGFSTGSSLYSQYNKSKLTASETDSQKIVVNSDSHTGYLYYHWCYASSYYSVEAKSGSYTTFHAYYDTTDPSNYNCDTSDMSYNTGHATCSNSTWWFVTDVYTQKYTTYNKVYTHAKWGDWSAWSDTAATASDTRKVETRTLYRYVDAPYADHTYVSGVCSVCGGVDPDYNPVVATVTAKSFTLSFEDEILVNLYFTVENASPTEMGMLVFNANPGTVSYAAADEVYADAVYNQSTGRYMSTTDGIAAKDMGDTRYYAAYVKLADGSYVYSKVYDYSPKKYALNMLAKTSTSDKQKALCVAMLNYGAEAQKYFSYKTDDLMNASLTAAQQALVVAYDASLFNGAIAVDTSKVGNFAKTSTGFSKKTASVSFDSAFAINYYFTPNATIDSNITFYYWTAEDYNAATTLTPSNATGKLTMMDNGSGVYWAEISGIAAKQIDDTYYVAGIYTSDTAVCSTGVVAYSLSKYCMGKAGDATSDMQGLCAATAVYGYYAKAYFTN